jgi:phenylpyruvate tautomerase PptA (4-oxalocrotonate tautomerase family)
MPFIRCVYSGEKEAKDDIIVAVSSAAAAALEKVPSATPFVDLHCL